MDIIFDIDGTLANVEHRRHFVEQPKKDWKSYNAAMHLDTPCDPIVRMAGFLATGGARVILARGREEVYRGATTAWLSACSATLFAAPLFMRPAKDYRSDTIVKREMLVRIRAAGYDPKIAIDDRSSVVAMWREAGLICLQCAEGNF